MSTLDERIQKALDHIRPYLQADGGDVQVVRMGEGGILELRWEGTCRTCPLSQMTLRAGVERVLMKECPEIKRVEAVSA
ncbi:MAG: NifU family protein [Ignavibacteria bacterium]|nr:NifU family protein [Ignavibacteria bacterium]